MSITRNVTETAVVYATVDVNEGNANLEHGKPFTVLGKLTEKKAIKEVEKRVGTDKQVVILSIDETTGKYEMDLETFVKHADKKEGAK